MSLTSSAACSTSGCRNQFSIFKKNYGCWLCNLRFCSDHAIKQRVCFTCDTQIRAKLSSQSETLRWEQAQQEIRYLRNQLQEIMNHSASKEDSSDELRAEKEKRLASERRIEELVAEQLNISKEREESEGERVAELERRLLSMKVELEKSRRSSPPLPSNSENETLKELLEISREEVDDLKKRLRASEENNRDLRRSLAQLESNHAATIKNVSLMLGEAERVMEGEREWREEVEREWQRVQSEASSSALALQSQLAALNLLDAAVKEMRRLVTRMEASEEERRGVGMSRGMNVGVDESSWSVGERTNTPTHPDDDDLMTYLESLPRGTPTDLIRIGKALSAPHAQTIASFLKTNFPTVIARRISLSGNHLGDEGARELSECLPHCLALSRLDLRHNFIADDGVAAICEALVRSRSITRLDLSGNSISERGAMHLARMLQENSVLTRLDIRHNSVAAAAPFLAGALTSNVTLQQLDLGSNDIKAEGCIALARALEINNMIRELDLRDNEVDMQAIVALQKALKSKSAAGERRVLWTQPATPR